MVELHRTHKLPLAEHKEYVISRLADCSLPTTTRKAAWKQLVRRKHPIPPLKHLLSYGLSKVQIARQLHLHRRLNEVQPDFVELLLDEPLALKYLHVPEGRILNAQCILRLRHRHPRVALAQLDAMLTRHRRCDLQIVQKTAAAVIKKTLSVEPEGTLKLLKRLIDMRLFSQFESGLTLDNEFWSSALARYPRESLPLLVTYYDNFSRHRRQGFSDYRRVRSQRLPPLDLESGRLLLKVYNFGFQALIRKDTVPEQAWQDWWNDERISIRNDYNGLSEILDGYLPTFIREEEARRMLALPNMQTAAQERLLWFSQLPYEEGSPDILRALHDENSEVRGKAFLGYAALVKRHPEHIENFFQKTAASKNDQCPVKTKMFEAINTFNKKTLAKYFDAVVKSIENGLASKDHSWELQDHLHKTCLRLCATYALGYIKVEQYGVALELAGRSTFQHSYTITVSPRTFPHPNVLLDLAKIVPIRVDSYWLPRSRKLRMQLAPLLKYLCGEKDGSRPASHQFRQLVQLFAPPISRSTIQCIHEYVDTCDDSKRKLWYSDGSLARLILKYAPEFVDEYLETENVNESRMQPLPVLHELRNLNRSQMERYRDMIVVHLQSGIQESAEKSPISEEASGQNIQHQGIFEPRLVRVLELFARCGIICEWDKLLTTPGIDQFPWLINFIHAVKGRVAPPTQFHEIITSCVHICCQTEIDYHTKFLPVVTLLRGLWPRLSNGQQAEYFQLLKTRMLDEGDISSFCTISPLLEIGRNMKEDTQTLKNVLADLVQRYQSLSVRSRMAIIRLLAAGTIVPDAQSAELLIEAISTSPVGVAIGIVRRLNPARMSEALVSKLVTVIQNRELVNNNDFSWALMGGRLFQCPAIPASTLGEIVYQSLTGKNEGFQNFVGSHPEPLVITEIVHHVLYKAWTLRDNARFRIYCKALRSVCAFPSSTAKLIFEEAMVATDGLGYAARMVEWLESPEGIIAATKRLADVSPYAEYLVAEAMEVTGIPCWGERRKRKWNIFTKLPELLLDEAPEKCGMLAVKMLAACVEWSLWTKDALRLFHRALSYESKYPLVATLTRRMRVPFTPEELTKVGGQGWELA